MLTLGASILVTVMATAFVLVALFMILVILIQKPKGGGLSGAFGGAGGSSQAAFGAKTGDLLTLITTGCFVVFLLLAGGLTYAIRADVAPKEDTPQPAESTADPVADAVKDALKDADATASDLTELAQDTAKTVQGQGVTVTKEAASPAAEPTTDKQP